METINTNVLPISLKTQNTTNPINITTSDIISYLVGLQSRLRYDLSELDWPSMIIGLTTHTHILQANVNITED